MIISLDESSLRSIIEDAVREYVSGRSDISAVAESAVSRHRSSLYEMAFRRKEYKNKVDNLSQQIIENWCLVRHCTICGGPNGLKEHWKDELKGYLLTVARYNIKGPNTPLDKEQAIREVWDANDYFDPKTVEYAIHNKFRKEGFNTSSPESLQVISDCIDSFNTLIPLVANGVIEALDNYVETI